MGNKFDRSKMCECDDGINFVGRSALNNGVACMVSKYNDTDPYPEGDITIALGGSIGASFIQEKPFYTSQNVCVLHAPEISMEAKRFITTIITVSCTKYEAFVDELNRHIKTDFTIPLPSTISGDPNWAYMENYMKEIKKRMGKSVEMMKFNN